MCILYIYIYFFITRIYMCVCVLAALAFIALMFPRTHPIYNDNTQ